MNIVAKRLFLGFAAVATLSACQTPVAEVQSGSVLAKAGHPAGFHYSPAQKVESGSCHVEIASPELVAFGCPSDKGTFIEYSKTHQLDECKAIAAWAKFHHADASCTKGRVEASLTVDGSPVHAEMYRGRLRVTQLSALD